MHLVACGLSIELLEVFDLGGRFTTVVSFFPAVDHYIKSYIPYFMGSGSSTTFLP
jgi:hypothetical protein